MNFLVSAAGIVPSVFDCYLVDRSLKTLKIRMEEHMKSALKVAKFLESHPMIEKVLYPGDICRSLYKLIGVNFFYFHTFMLE